MTFTAKLLGLTFATALSTGSVPDSNNTMGIILNNEPGEAARIIIKPGQGYMVYVPKNSPGPVEVVVPSGSDGIPSSLSMAPLAPKDIEKFEKDNSESSLLLPSP